MKIAAVLTFHAPSVEISQFLSTFAVGSSSTYVSLTIYSMKRILFAIIISMLGLYGFAQNPSLIDRLKKTYKNVKLQDKPVPHITVKDKSGDKGHIFLPDGTLLYSDGYGDLALKDTITAGGDLYYLVGHFMPALVNSQGKVIKVGLGSIDSRSTGDSWRKGDNASFHNVNGYKFFTIAEFYGPDFDRSYGGTSIISSDGRVIHKAANDEYIRVIGAPDGLFFSLRHHYHYPGASPTEALLDADGKEIISPGSELKHLVLGGKSYFISFRSYPGSQVSSDSFYQIYDATGKPLPGILAKHDSYIELDGHAFFILQNINKGFGDKLTKGDSYVYSPDFNISMPWEDNDKDLSITTENGKKTLVKTDGNGKATRQILESNPMEVAVAREDRSASSRPVATHPAMESSPTTVSDIDTDIPEGKVSRPNTFALIIANENYRRVASVPYASKDGEVLAKYLNRTLGLPEKNIIRVDDASLNDISYNLERLGDICDAYDGTASVIVYYAGHGVPDDATKDAYLLPTDGYAESAAKSGFSLARLISAVEAMPTRQATIFIDACFSGASRDGEMLSAVRGVRLKPKENSINGKVVVFSASQGEETAQPYKEQGHGLFTYFLIRKLKETRGEVTLGELYDYVNTQVRRTSVINGQKQTPSIKVAPDNTIWSVSNLGSNPEP